MPSIDVRGHLVPNGSEPASRQSLLDFSQSVPSVKACDSETAAIQHINALKAAGVKITESNPAFVWRSDIRALLVWDGLRWAGTSRFRIETQQTGDSGIAYSQPGQNEIMILQTGRLSNGTYGHANGAGFFSFQPFPQPFPKACLTINITKLYNNSGKFKFISNAVPMVDRLDRTGFRVMFPGEKQSTAHSLMWQAIGY